MATGIAGANGVACSEASVTAVGALTVALTGPCSVVAPLEADVLQPVPVGLAGLDRQVLVGVGKALRAAGRL